VQEYDLLTLCRKRGLSFGEVGRRMQPPVTRNAVSNWANGERGLTPENAAQIAAILQIDAAEVMRAVEIGKAWRRDSKISPNPPAAEPGIARRRRHPRKAIAS
jgi:transcriptional regulator with XRE-family HTH domain